MLPCTQPFTTTRCSFESYVRKTFNTRNH